MKAMICPALSAAAAFALLASCAQPPRPVQALSPGPTPEEVAGYARAQAQYRSGLALGNGDLVTQATDTFSLISREILSRQDPQLFDAQVVCESFPVAGPRDQRKIQATYGPQFAQDCQPISWRYNQATMAIRRDLETRIMADDRAIIVQVEAGHS